MGPEVDAVLAVLEVDVHDLHGIPLVGQMAEREWAVARRRRACIGREPSSSGRRACLPRRRSRYFLPQGEYQNRQRPLPSGSAGQVKFWMLTAFPVLRRLKDNPVLLPRGGRARLGDGRRRAQWRRPQHARRGDHGGGSAKALLEEGAAVDEAHGTSITRDSARRQAQRASRCEATSNGGAHLPA